MGVVIKSVTVYAKVNSHKRIDLILNPARRTAEYN